MTAPENRAGGVACSPEKESHEIADRIEHKQIEPTAIVNDGATDGEGESQAGRKSQGQKADRQADMVESHAGQQP